MCRYAYANYKPHLACFACRKVYRRRLPSDADHQGPSKPPVCPDCAGPVADMGRDFKAPPREDRKAWQLAARLWTIGETFHSCGCGGPGYRPRDPDGYREFLTERRRWYHENLRSATIDPRRTGFDERADAEAYWRIRLAAIEAGMREAGMPLPPLAGG
ncbi:MAG: hypothetical protein R6X02_07740 [Enhygromyxa sp.]